MLKSINHVTWICVYVCIDVWQTIKVISSIEDLLLQCQRSRDGRGNKGIKVPLIALFINEPKTKKYWCSDKTLQLRAFKDFILNF